MEQNLTFIREGSSKDIYRADLKSLAWRFLDCFSVFDVGRSSYGIAGKGKAICACAVRSFQIAEQIGVPTCFIEQLDEVTIRVKEAQVITNRPLTLEDENYVVPSEFITRVIVAGSIGRAFKDRTKKPEDYGLPAGEIPPIGTPFPYPIHQVTTKFETVDRELTPAEMREMSGITLKDEDEFWRMIDRVDGAIGIEMARAGFIWLDGKKECIIGPGRSKMLGDVFGTQDEDRPAIIVDGEVIHYSKEYLRQIFIANGYYKEVNDARKVGRPVPPIPPITEEQLAEVSRRYKLVADTYGKTA